MHSVKMRLRFTR